MTANNYDIIGYMPVKVEDIPDYDPAKGYIITNCKGDCMNSPRSPMRIKDGDRVLSHPIDKAEAVQHIGKVIGVKMQGVPYYDDCILVKELTGATDYAGLELRCYNPPTSIVISWCAVETVYLIDAILFQK